MARPQTNRQFVMTSIPVADLCSNRECASDDCYETSLWHVVSGDVGSYYCGDCAMEIWRLANHPRRKGKY